MSLGTVTVDGITVEIYVLGMSEVQNINGTKELHLHLAPIFPGGGPGGSEAIPVAA